MSVFTNSAGRSAENARAYTEAILDLLGSQHAIDVLHETPPALRAAVAGLSDDRASQPEAPGKWSVRQVVRHLADSDVVWAFRLRMVLAEDRPTLTGYDQDHWAERLRYADADISNALDEFTVLRRGNLRLLDAATPADLRRVGLHAERGEESVEHMMKLYAGHDLLHLRQIDRIRRAIGG
jgi:hypothetical protein